VLKIGIRDNVNVISDSDSDPYYFSKILRNFRTKFPVFYIITNVSVVYMALILNGFEAYNRHIKKKKLLWFHSVPSRLVRY
jgi:hypothetical protein